MDEKSFANLFRSLQSVMRCPSCSSVYEMTEMHFLGSKDGYFLLSLNCSKCSLPVWVNVFAGNGAPISFNTELTVSDLTLSERDPIAPNEVVDFHLFLKNFDGNFKKVFSKM